MRLFLMTALVMAAFAANSVLNRAAIEGGHAGALDFANWRVASGAAALVLLVLIRDRRRPGVTGPGRVTGTLSLVLYLVAFSLAYRGLDAGIGALILFGGVQITMFAGAVLAREAIPPLRWVGAAVAFAGLVWLLWPGGAAAVSPGHAGLMLAAAAGWGVYSLAGRRATDPLAATAANFLLATPACLLLALALPGASVDAPPMTGTGLILALTSGIVTSALGYALWYAVLPRLDASVAAVAQLTVPVIAVAGGAAFLGESLGLRTALAGAVVLGGIALSVLGPQRTRGSSGS